MNAEVAARAEAAKARSADRLAEVREAVARVLGANTRLSISRSESSADFVYRAIDVDTGEIVNEWPQEVFIDLIRGVRDDVRSDVDAGLMLDRVA
ncbi:MAG: flagellar protein FlaG [Parvularculaceae bacterium]|nr:flagellar protein FlaG [Parvularculaceae bacterium]